ncbi:MAG: hypothetical protein ACLP9L_00090 [Thermoguttaceae bacterium]
MTRPDNIPEDVQYLGEDGSHSASMAEEHWIELVSSYVDKMGWSITAKLFSDWFPRLTEFAATKRAENPLPSPNALLPTEQAWNRILEPKIVTQKSVPKNGPITALIFTAPLCTLQLVQSHWPGSVKNAVFLTPSELQDWYSNYHDPDGAFSCGELGWYACQWWKVDDKIEIERQSDYWFRDGPLKLPSGLDPWLVHWGHQWGGKSGSESAELWCWDGVREQLIRTLGYIVS